MKRINIDISKEDLDFFLKENYGYEYWNFADSFVSVYALYKLKDWKKINKLIKSRTEGIENLKKRIVELIDYFLIDIDFYKNSHPNYPSNKFKYKWTLNNKKSFITSRFQLEPFFSILDNLNDRYYSYVYSYSDSKIYLKPINLVIMIWSHALLKNNRVNWINLEILLKWFLKMLEEIDVLDIYGIKDKEIPSPERLRFINNKYKGTIHEKTAFSIYMKSFKDKEEISRSKKMTFISTNAEKIDYLDPLTYLDEYLWSEKTPEALISLYDMIIRYQIQKTVSKNQLVD